MNYKRLIVTTFIMLVLAGCSKPTIDASTDESMKASVEKVRNSLSEEEKIKFDEAMRIVAFSNIDVKDLFADGVLASNSLEGKMKQSLQGKTANDIIAQAESIKQERAAKEKEQALSEIKELIKKQVEAEQAKSELAKFRVERSRFYKKRREFIGQQPIIEISVVNGTSQPISRVYFKGTLSSKGRSVPWLREDFNYEISGGLEPSEKATWHLSPNMFSNWGKVDIPSDALFTVEVEQLDGANKESLFSVKSFSEEDANRLTELKKKYGQ